MNRAVLLGGGIVLGLAGTGALLVASGVLPSPFRGAAPPRGAKVTIQSIAGPSGMISEGHQTLTVVVENSGTATADIGVEAIIVGADGLIHGLWFSTQHPAGAFPGGQDQPAWFQFRARSVAPGQLVTATFGTTFETTGGPWATVVYAAPLSPRYTGPLVTGKRIGAPVSGLVDVVPGGVSVLVSRTTGTFQVVA